VVRAEGVPDDHVGAVQVAVTAAVRRQAVPTGLWFAVVAGREPLRRVVRGDPSWCPVNPARGGETASGEYIGGTS